MRSKTAARGLKQAKHASCFVSESACVNWDLKTCVRPGMRNFDRLGLQFCQNPYLACQDQL